MTTQQRLANAYYHFRTSVEGGDDYGICVWGEKLNDAQHETGVTLVEGLGSIWTDALLRELEG
jgi:hypothetical protein